MPFTAEQRYGAFCDECGKPYSRFRRRKWICRDRLKAILETSGWSVCIKGIPGWDPQIVLCPRCRRRAEYAG